MIARKAQLILLFISINILTIITVQAQESDVETASLNRERMTAFLSTEAARLSEEAFARIDTKEKLDSCRDTLRQEFLYMIGLDHHSEKTPLQVELIRTIDAGEYTIEVLGYQSMPGFYVSANLYRPKKGKGPFPAVVWGPGHSPHINGAKTLRQLYAIPWVRSGYVCLIIDPVQVAEIYAAHRGTHSWDAYDWYSRGYTPAGIEVWNAIRGLDYLLSRDDVDPDKITINGVSGGGHLSWMSGAADPRFTIVQPVAGTADIQAHVQLDLQRQHCDCAYFINIFRHDWPTLAAMISPRPLLMHNSSEDSYYPPEGYVRVLDKSKKIYGMQGGEDKTAMFEVPGRHGYYQLQREKAVEWSDKWLLGKNSDIHERPFEETPGDQLDVYPDDFKPDAINGHIQELFIPRAEPKAPSSISEWKKTSTTVMENLNSYVFRNMPAVSSPKVINTTENGVIFETEKGIHIGMSSYNPAPDSESQPALLYVASPGETLDGIWNFLRSYPFIKDNTLRWIVFPRGTGSGIWTDIEMRRFERSAMLLGRSVDEMRLYDVLCAVEHVTKAESFDKRNLTICGKERQGIIAAYAALLDERISRVIVSRPPSSHTEGPVFLNVLRYTDIAQTFAMLAPRELVFLGEQGERFELAPKVYSLLNAEDRFRHAVTVTQVLNGR